MSDISANTSTPKAKKARKPFIWTPERKATFEKMKAKRQESLAVKAKAKEDGKLEVLEEKKSIERLSRIKEEMKKLLQVLDKPKVEEVKAITVEKPIITPKPIAKPIRKPEPEPELEDEEEEEEEIPIPPPRRPQPIEPKKDLYRYTTKNQHYSIPKPAYARPPARQVEMPEKPKFMYL